MPRSKDLRINIIGDADKLDKEIRRSNNSLDKLGKQTRLTSSVTSKGFAGMRVAAVGAAGALGGVALAGKRVVEAAIESERSQARLATQLKASGISYKAHAAEIDRVIQKHSQLAGVDDEDLQDAFTAIVRTTGSVSTAMRDMGLVTDLARSKNMDVAKAGDAVAKIHAGQYRALKTLNLEFVKSTDHVDKLKASNDKITPAELAAAKAADVRANAQRALALVQEKVRGQAEAYGNTTAGAMERAGVAVEGLEESIGGALAPTVEKAANGVAKFVGEMQDGTGQGGKFARTLKDIWSEVRPIVTWIGRATKNTANFAAEHPAVAKLAGAIVGVGLALKGLRFLSAATGFSSILKAGGVAAKGLKRILSRGGVAAGEAAAANAAEGMAAQMPASLKARQGRFNNATRNAGRLAGRAFGAALVVGLFSQREQISDALDDVLGRNSRSIRGRTTGDTGGSPFGIIGDAFNRITGRATGGIIPGSGSGDTVPAMLEPGEFVVRKQIVQKFGPTFFAKVNEGMEPQRFTGGGIVARANKLDAMRIPYLYGGGHGTRDGFNRGGMDCSASVSYALGITPRVSGALMNFGRPGPGSPNDTKIYANPSHVFAVFNGRGWGTSRENPGGGPGWLSYNHRSGFTIRHLDDGHEKGEAGDVSVGGDAQELVESGKQRAERRKAAAERAGSRAVNRIANKFAKGVAAATRSARSLGGRIEDAGDATARSERRFGQTDEDLGTAAGRAKRTDELTVLKKEKQNIVAEMTRRLRALKRAESGLIRTIRGIDAQLTGKGRARGAKAAKIRERRVKFRDDLAEVRAEIKGLGGEIEDAKLDIGDIDKDIAEVAGTEDTGAEEAREAARPENRVSAALSDIDLQERAGILSPADANAARQSVLQRALAGEFGGLDQRQQWALMGDLRDAQQAATDAQREATEATNAQTQAMRDLKASIDQNTAVASSVTSTSLREATRAFADHLSGQMGQNYGQRRTMPGSGQLASVGNSKY